MMRQQRNTSFGPYVQHLANLQNYIKSTNFTIFNIQLTVGRIHTDSHGSIIHEIDLHISPEPSGFHFQSKVPQ